MTLKTAMALGLATVVVTACPGVALGATCAAARSTPAQAVDGLIAADRAFSAAGAGQDLVTSLSAMFDADVVMGTPKGFATGKAAVTEALRANPANPLSKVEWVPARAGISADGTHGFTAGYMTIRQPGTADRRAKYLAYWVKRPEGWRVALYKRLGRAAEDVTTAILPSVLPAKLVCAAPSKAATAQDRASLDWAERNFSDQAQKIGLTGAFRTQGSVDAINLGAGPGLVVGAVAIAGPDDGGKPAGINWKPDGVIVAPSGDFGVTWGFIKPNAPPAAGAAPAPGSPYFTIWHRATRAAPWRYLAE